MDEDELSIGGRAAQSSCKLGKKKLQLALDQVNELERSFKMDKEVDRPKSQGLHRA